MFVVSIRLSIAVEWRRSSCWWCAFGRCAEKEFQIFNLTDINQWIKWHNENILIILQSAFYLSFFRQIIVFGASSSDIVEVRKIGRTCFDRGSSTVAVDKWSTVGRMFVVSIRLSIAVEWRRSSCWWCAFGRCAEKEFQIFNLTDINQWTKWHNENILIILQSAFYLSFFRQIIVFGASSCHIVEVRKIGRTCFDRGSSTVAVDKWSTVSRMFVVSIRLSIAVEWRRSSCWCCAFGRCAEKEFQMSLISTNESSDIMKTY